MISVTVKKSVDFLRGGAMTESTLPTSSKAEEPEMARTLIRRRSGCPTCAVPACTREIHQGKEPLEPTSSISTPRYELRSNSPSRLASSSSIPTRAAWPWGRRLPRPTHERARPILSAFGGIVGLNRALDGETARALTSTFIEAVIAPAVDEEAKPILATKANLRVATTDFAKLAVLDNEFARDARSFLGGTLMQDRDLVTEARTAVAAGRLPEGRDQTRADSRRVDGASLRVARLRSRQVERRDLHQR